MKEIAALGIIVLLILLLFVAGYFLITTQLQYGMICSIGFGVVVFPALKLANNLLKK